MNIRSRYLILVLALIGCGSNNSTSTISFPYQSTTELCSQVIKDPSKPTIYGYGDSTMAGNLVGCENSYIDLVAKRLHYNIINKGSGGSGMFGQNQYYSMMSDIWPNGSIVVFIPGINDISFEHQDTYGVAIYQQQYIQALQNVINRVSKLNVQVFIGTPLPPNTNVEQSSYTQDIAFYASVNITLVQQTPNIHLIDLNTWYEPTSVIDIDWIHPNIEGNKLIAHHVFKLIKEVLEQ